MAKKVSCGFGELDLCTISRLWLSHSENLISRSNTNLYVPSTIVVSKLGHVPWDILVCFGERVADKAFKEAQRRIAKPHENNQLLVTI